MTKKTKRPANKSQQAASVAFVVVLLMVAQNGTVVVQSAGSSEAEIVAETSKTLMQSNRRF